MRNLLVSVIAALALCETNAQNANMPPKIVVNITIDQLRYDYIERFSPLFGEKGFKKLIKEGRVYKNGYQDFVKPDAASAITSIQTGTSPSVHGIISNEWYDRVKDKIINSVEDNAYLGNYIKNGYSPNKIMVSTLADELKIASQKSSIIYSIAATPECAILAGGRNANNAFWINPETGKWCTSTYYYELPFWAADYNETESLTDRIDSIDWTPLLPSDKYIYLKSEWGEKDFCHKYKNSRHTKYERYIKGGLINEEINDFAIKCLENSSMGHDNITDMLLLTYYAGNYENRSTIECPYEIQDTYVRLDKELERIITYTEKKYGLNNIMFVVSSTGYIGKDNADLSTYNIPTGEFYLNRCAALLNMYLIAQYGQGNYVTGYRENQIYLNHDLIKERKLDFDEIMDKTSEFLVTFNGISETYTSKRIMLGAWTPERQKWRNSFNRERSGDIMIELLPGWSSREENSYEYRVERANFTSSPIIFWWNGIKGEVINTPTNNNIIAPTVAYYLRIRAPNAAKAIPVTDMK